MTPPAPPTPDPAHWLYRLSPQDWLAAAATELDAASAAFTRHGVRAGVTHCRRGAGMALNALLWRHDLPQWGRSYMEHVVALANDSGAGPLAVPADIRTAAQTLRETPAQAPKLLTLGAPGKLDPAAEAALAAARAIVAWATAQLS